MGQYTTQITSLVASSMPNGDGFTSTQRTAMVTFLDTDIVTLVTEDNYADEFDEQIDSVISESDYSAATGDFLTLLKTMCESTINFPKEYYIDGAQAGANYPVGAKVFRAMLSQASTSAPTARVMQNTIGATPTYGYTSTGIYTIDFGVGGLLTGNKTTVTIAQAGVTNQTSAVVTNTNVVTVTTASEGVAVFAVANAVLSNTTIEIVVYP